MENKNSSVLFDLILGTAQLGLKEYGVNNKTGQPDSSEALSIVDRAIKSGVNTFDTAVAYGSSQKVLGRAFKDLGITKEVDVITKIGSLQLGNDGCNIQKCIENTLDQLNLTSLCGLLLHDEKMLFSWNQGLGRSMLALKAKGFVMNLGVSVYSMEKALDALMIDEIDIIEVPFNIFDQRVKSCDLVNKAKENKKQLILRGVFLQGALLMDPSNISGKLSFLEAPIKKLDALCNKFDLSRKELVLGFVKANSGSCGMIFGAERAVQVEETVKIIRKVNLSDFVKDEIGMVFSDMQYEKHIIDPRLWGM